jgi:non-specific serine/threonine protein kinase
MNEMLDMDTSGDDSSGVENNISATDVNTEAKLKLPKGNNLASKFSTQKEEEKYVLIFSLQKYDMLEHVFYFPHAYIASIFHNEPAYIQKLGITEVIASYGIELSEVEKSLLAIIEELNPNFYEKKYNNGKGKKKGLVDLLSDKIIKVSILKLYQIDLAKFLHIIQNSNLSLYFGVQRSIHISENLLLLSDEVFVPISHLVKTSLGLNYSLVLDNGKKTIIPSTSNLVVLLHEPSIVLFGKILIKIADFNGKLLIPFLKKDSIFVPDRMVKSYFTGFVKDAICKYHVEVDGFEYNLIQNKPTMSITFAPSLIKESYEMLIGFEYQGEKDEPIKFSYGDKASYKVLINFGENDEINVTKVERDIESETQEIEYLKSFGLNVTSAKRLGKDNDVDQYAVLQLAIAQGDTWLSRGTSITWPTINGTLVCGLQSKIAPKKSLINDWFDIKALVKVGEVKISFASLIRNIKENNRLFKLKTGEIFIIPQEWMAKYGLLAKFATVKEDQVLLPKMNFAILEEVFGGGNINSSHAHVVEARQSNDEEITLPKGLKAELRPYQLEGYNWLVRHFQEKNGACLADDMGLGKTLQTIALMLHVHENSTRLSEDLSVRQMSLFDEVVPSRNALGALVVLPSSLVFNWQNEINRFAPSLFVKTHTGQSRVKDIRVIKRFDVLITTYQTFLQDFDLLNACDFQMLICDESHYIKNRQSKIFSALMSIGTQFRVSLSGTPIENSLADLWSQMQFINPNILGDYRFFQKNYQMPIEKAGSVELLNELKLLLGPFILRRTKKNVLKDLPDVEELVFYSDMNKAQTSQIEEEKSKYRNMFLGAAEDDLGVNKIHVFNALMKLRQIANHPKLVDAASNGESGKFDDVTVQLLNIIKGGHKVLVFSSFRGHIALFEDFLKEQGIGFALLTGECSQNQRKAAVDKFESEEDCSVFLMTIKAGGVGLNLTSANYVIILDPWWNPFVERQAIARAHRIGQLNKVTVIRFIARDSIEEKILNLQNSKLQMAGNFLEIDEMPEIDKMTLSYLLE